ncbi:DUF2490 domain-containing protein [Chryseobacterium salipaludis]|uniref:DUF2490 domain-containing protein n=1 Tax=Chryseobacterium TaxID=59732 RepID=UPI001FF3378F|nr:MULTISPECIES: DUF2490 domain-containing protein [Chryseobacterium]MCJ8497715.1 DUF2490 domain-containing protein [Chryseobacterium salipaludis]MCX3297086.1 DUF2490 domain-containing protein [Planobacterium sp. JC490]
MKKISSVIMLLCCAVVVSAQEHLSGYNVININYQFLPKWFVYTEGQVRSNEDFSYPDYYEIKGGLGYELADNHKPLIGIGRYGSYENHRLEKEEFRVWLQDVYELSAGRFEFENRVRAEKSWFYEPQSGEKSDRVRFRYRLNVSVPVNREKVVPGTISANAYNEVFFVAEAHPGLARNRVFGGLSYQIDKAISLSSGYLWQREFSVSGNENLHFLYLALSLKLKSKSAEKK